MYTLTKIALMWERLGEVIKDVAGIHKTIDENKAYTPPAYSSTVEVNTGQKWLDGRDVYCKVFSGTFDTIESNTNITVGNVPNSTILKASTSVINASGDAGAIDRFYFNHNITSGNIWLANVTSTYSGGKYIVIVYYVKNPATRSDDLEKVDKGTGMLIGEDPEPEQETKTVKRKTTKKEENNK